MTPAPYQIWKEVDPRTERYVRVEGVDPSGVHIRAVWKLRSEWTIRPRSRLTIANPDRFNGKRGGYTYVENSRPAWKAEKEQAETDRYDAQYPEY